MMRNAERVALVKYTVLLAALSLGLSGCKTCQNIKKRIPFFGRHSEVVQTGPPEVGPVSPPPLVAAPTPAPEPKIAAPPKEEKTAPRPEREPDLEKALQMVHFDFDSAVLTDVARRILDKNIAWLKAHPNVRVQIEGHCDERGTEEYNLHLGERRAESVKRYLVQNGIDPSRLFTISYGEERPIDPRHNESAWAKNRRVQFSRY